MDSEKKLQSDLEARIEQADVKPEAEVQRPKPPAPSLQGFWSCEMFPNLALAGLGAGDWDPSFDNPAEERIYFDIASPTGHLFFYPSVINRAVRARFGFNNLGAAYTVQGAMIGDTFGRVQIKVNGAMSNYTANADIDFNLKPGFNLIQVAGNENMNRIDLYVKFIDNVRGHFVSPFQTPGREMPPLGG